MKSSGWPNGVVITGTRAAFGERWTGVSPLVWLAAHLSPCRIRRPVEVRYKRPREPVPHCGEDEYFFSQVHGEDFAVSYRTIGLSCMIPC